MKVNTMAKGILSFELPEDEEEFRCAQEGAGWKYLVMDLLAHLRAQIKHTDTKGDKKLEAKLAGFEEVRDIIWNSIQDRNLKAD